MVHISGCDSGAFVCCASFECVGMRKYDDANVLFYACWFARPQMLWSSLQGFVRTAGCTLRRLCLPEMGLINFYHVLTDDACLMRCEFCCCFHFSSSVFSFLFYSDAS